ncbi:phosphoglycerate dehydrogenase [Candidatus Poribacteria bacterium]
MKILIADPLSDQGIEILRKEEDIDVEVKTDLSHEELIKCVGQYDALIVRSGTNVTSEVIEAADTLKVIGRAGVGTDNVDVRAATRRGILVVNTPGANTVSAAEHTMTLILALSRNIAPANISLRGGRWERRKFIGVEVYNKTLGIIGLGRIGTEVAGRATAFGMNVIAADPYISPDHAARLDIHLVEVSEIIEQADYISVHLPLTKETHHLLGEREFAAMKDGVRVVNCARGGIYDEEALYNAIVNGKVAGAALDVYEDEPPLNSPLLELDSVLTTPHLGASTMEAQVNVSIEVAHQVLDALKGLPVRNAVNMPPVSPADFEKIGPYIELAEKLGRFQSQLIEGHVTELYIDYSGEVGEYTTTMISIALQKALLERFLGETVSYVNAPLIARERGIKVVETKSSTVEGFANLISVTVKTDKGERRAAGTIFGTKDGRIVMVDDHHVDVVPQGYMLVISNEDKPGVMGTLCTLLGECDINIAAMSLGRKNPGGEAVVILNLDSIVPGEVMDRIRALDNIWEARLVNLN